MEDEMDIDFSATDYTVKSPGDGQPTRYTEEAYPYAVKDAKRHFTDLSAEFPNLSRFVVPDHYIQEYCREYDCGLWSGSRGYGTDRFGPFLRLAERGARRAPRRRGACRTG